MKKLVKMIIIDNIETQSRDLRELNAAREAGWDVSVLARGFADGRDGSSAAFASFPLTRVSVIKKRTPYSYHVFFQMAASWIKHLKQLEPDAVSAHNLPAFTLAYIYKKTSGRKHPPALIYDSHEFELGKNIDRSGLWTAVVCRAERFLMRRCAFSLMVNDSIADKVQQTHRLEQRPLVVRNIPLYCNIDKRVIERRRSQMLADFGVSDGFIAMYHGGVMRARGIETLIRAAAQNEHILAAVLGPALHPDYYEKLRSLIDELGVSERVRFFPAVAQSSLWEYVGAADAGVMMISPSYESYRLCLPNKLFECIQSETPPVASALPEMSRVIEKYGVGLTCAPDDPKALSDTLEALRTDKEQYGVFKKNLVAAKKELCWEKESRILVDAYTALLSGCEDVKG